MVLVGVCPVIGGNDDAVRAGNGIAAELPLPGDGVAAEPDFILGLEFFSRLHQVEKGRFAPFELTDPAGVLAKGLGFAIHHRAQGLALAPQLLADQ